MNIEIGKQYLLNMDPEDLAVMPDEDRELFEAHQGKPVTIIKVAATFPLPLGNAYWVRGEDCWEDSVYADELKEIPDAQDLDPKS
jgi:hypothetical protein